MYDEDPFDQSAAKRDYVRAARRKDRDESEIAQSAYEAGREAGEQSGTNAPRQEETGGRRLSVPSPVTKSGGSVAGAAFGLIGYALFLAALREGPKGPLMWIKAKFINQV